jgi:hypothetical protein
MASMTTMRVSRGFSVGFLIAALNFKHILIVSAAGVVITSSGLSAPSMVVAFVLFILLATSSATLPVLAHRVLGPAFDARTGELYRWLVANNATIMSVLLLVIGVVVIGEGIGSF